MHSEKERFVEELLSEALTQMREEVHPGAFALRTRLHVLVHEEVFDEEFAELVEHMRVEAAECETIVRARCSAYDNAHLCLGTFFLVPIDSLPVLFRISNGKRTGGLEAGYSVTVLLNVERCDERVDHVVEVPNVRESTHRA